MFNDSKIKLETLDAKIRITRYDPPNSEIAEVLETLTRENAGIGTWGEPESFSSYDAVIPVEVYPHTLRVAVETSYDRVFYSIGDIDYANSDTIYRFGIFLAAQLSK